MGKSITVITPTTGNPLLLEALKSVESQDYRNGEIVHLVVIDGEEHKDKLFQTKAYDSVQAHDNIRFAFQCLPWATGKYGFNGHRIYGAFSFLVNTDYVCFLDEDNYFEPNHIKSFLNVVNRRKEEIHWGYSLRKIVDSNSRFLCEDNCESLGYFPTWMNEGDYLVDVGCYFLSRQVAAVVAPLWYRIARPTGGLMEVDRAIAHRLIHETRFNYYATGRHTLNYRVGSRPDSVQDSFFESGNKYMKDRYMYWSAYPWHTNERNLVGRHEQKPVPPSKKSLREGELVDIKIT